MSSACIKISGYYPVTKDLPDTQVEDNSHKIYYD